MSQTSNHEQTAADKPNYPLRRALALGVTVLAVMGAKDVVQYGANKVGNIDAITRTYTDDELEAMHQVPMTVPESNGSDAVIARVEPQILTDPELRYEVGEYINQQGEGIDHQLQAGQTVQVPVVDVTK